MKSQFLIATTALILSVWNLVIPVASVGYLSPYQHKRVDIQSLAHSQPVMLAEETQATELFKDSIESVVAVEVKTKTDGFLGTGCIVTEDGFVLTANHVIDAKGAKIQVRFSNGFVAPAVVVKKDAVKDLALLKIQVDNVKFKALKLENPSKVTVGRTLYLIGNPFGLYPIMTKGMVSRIPDKDVPVLVMNIQANPGNSGGPVFDSDGKIVGVIVSIFREDKNDRDNVGISYAVPLSVILDFLLK